MAANSTNYITESNAHVEVIDSVHLLRWYSIVSSAYTISWLIVIDAPVVLLWYDLL